MPRRTPASDLIADHAAGWMRTGGAVTEFGMRNAKELYCTGDSVSGAEAASIGMINCAWPAAELETRTLAFAERITIMSSDHLAMLKLTMYRFCENMGIYSSIRSATEQGLMAQMTEFACDFGRKFEEGGIKAAVEWRDRPCDRKLTFSDSCGRRKLTRDLRGLSCFAEPPQPTRTETAAGPFIMTKPGAHGSAYWVCGTGALSAVGART